MIVSDGQYYLYRHIRLDKNEPFYIGVGKKTEQDLQYFTYTRANDKTKKGRNSIWHHIFSKTEYRVEILMESNSYEFLLQKEIEFVALYGRIKFNTGTLANILPGGEGTIGFRHSEESKQKMSLKCVGRYRSKESIEKGLKTKRDRGYKPTKETGNKISKAQKERWANNPPIRNPKNVYTYIESNVKYYTLLSLYEGEFKICYKSFASFHNAFFKYRKKFTDSILIEKYK